jgi:thioredoxin-like negative regulator of GroEL
MMIRSIPRSALLLLLLLLVIPSEQQQQQPQQQQQQQPQQQKNQEKSELTIGNFEKFMRESTADSHSSVLVKFYAPWCGNCQRMEEAWRSLQEDFAYSPSVKIASVNCVDEEVLCSSYGISEYPKIGIFRTNGRLDEAYEGRRDYESMKTFVESALEVKCDIISSRGSSSSSEREKETCSAEEIKYVEKWRRKCSDSSEEEKKARASNSNSYIIADEEDKASASSSSSVLLLSKEIERLTRLSEGGERMTAELRVWLFQRMSLLTQLLRKMELGRKRSSVPHVEL